jgi:dynein assembly factor 1
LDKYVNLKSIWLECNGITKIEGLSHLTQLRMLYLHQNALEKIEGLEECVNLITLNLSHNRLKKIEGLSMLPLLKNLDVSHNVISDIADIDEVKTYPSLTSLDLSHNYIDNTEEIVPFFSQFQILICLYLKGNPCVRKVSMYRKRLTANMKSLHYLDDRPVAEIERIAADAWLAGGNEAEKEARRIYQEEKDAKMRSYTQRGVEL